MDVTRIADGIGALIVVFLIFGFPIMQIVHRAGYSRVWILVVFVPFANLIALWAFAFSRWPIEEGLGIAKN